GLTVIWAKYRGPGDVQFSATQTKLANGTATTSATFTEPGDYILQAVVDDGSGESARNFGYYCCWTNGQGKSSAKGARAQPAHNHKPQISTKQPQPPFEKVVAAFFQKSSQTCHHQGTSAPMSLVSYDEVRPWARSIRQRVANREMPPWHLDKTVGI